MNLEDVHFVAVGGDDNDFDLRSSNREKHKSVTMDTYTFATSRQIDFPVCIKM